MGAPKHRLSLTPLYSIWKHMRQRCQNPNNKDYRYYGGRGIRICERWQHFPNFLEDMGERPEGKSLDRIDNSGPYSPENCRWVSHILQMNNMRRNWRYQGKTQRQWGEILGITDTAVCMRFKKYGDVYIPKWAKRALRRSAGYRRTGK